MMDRIGTPRGVITMAQPSEELAREIERQTDADNQRGFEPESFAVIARGVMACA
ncbi:hypothetical protein [Streptomyces sp. NPDC057966]|uniref:hypothetical protein n=1 Tax=Streptomyces sp. NPDC057966 TaxID=3346292 RepID=UPI0036ED6B43